MVARIFLALIRAYQKATADRPPSCKYVPSCSAYAAEAIRRYGAGKGFFLAVWRILRCNPFSKGGYDPVK